MGLRKATLSQQIFLSMIGLISFSLLIISVVNIQQIQNETRNYNTERLSRKDRSVAKSIEAIINLGSRYNVDLETAFKPILSDIGHIHKLKINIYNLKGEFIWSSDTTLLNDHFITLPIPEPLMAQCFSSEKRKINYEKGQYFGTYRVLYQNEKIKKLTSSEPVITNNPYCILDVVYDKSTKEDVLTKTNKQIIKLVKVYLLLLLLTIAFAYLLIKQITSPLRSISRHLSSTELTAKPEPLTWPVKDEIGQLVDSYNILMKELDIRTKQLIKSEKEGAWKKMAKQIAHEIKNPLTPMRLNIQYLKKSFDDGKGKGLYSDNWEEKLIDFSTTMIQQIDTLTRIANAFSDFASLDAQSVEEICVQSEVTRIINLFKNNNVRLITANSPKKPIHTVIDKSHLTRVLNNLIKNSIQAARENVPIEVTVELKLQKNVCIILIRDNGTGIPPEIQEKVFEPNFTTKNSGMGLGLAMVKKIIDDFKGSISYSTSSTGTLFKIEIPIQKKTIK